MNGYVQSSCPLCWSCSSSACSIAIRNVQRYSPTKLKLNTFFGGGGELLSLFSSQGMSQRVWARESGLQQSVPYANMDCPLICAPVPVFMYRRAAVCSVICSYMCICMSMYLLCMHIFIFLCIYLHLDSHIYIYMYIFMWIYVYIVICCFICRAITLLFWSIHIASSRFFWYKSIIRYFDDIPQNLVEVVSCSFQLQWFQIDRYHSWSTYTP